MQRSTRIDDCDSFRRQFVKRLFNWALGCFYLSVSTAWGAPLPEHLPPSAGVLERELEEEYEGEVLEPTKDVPMLEIDVPKEQLSLGSGIRISVEEFCFVGNEAIDEKQLQQWAAGYAGTKLSMEEIRNLCLRIEAEYARRGYFLARAFPPIQEVQNGSLTIQIMEGKLGAVIIEGNRYYKAEFIQSYLDKLIGKPIQYDDLLKALFLINENKKLRVGGLLTKGQAVGTADLIVTVKDEWPASLYLDCNNYGSLQTATWRAGSRFEVGNLLTQGDVLSIAGVVGLPITRLQFTDLIYKVPVTRQGTILSLSYLFAHFKLGVFNDLDLGGMSNIWTAKVSQAIWRTRHWSSDVYAAFDIKQVQNTSHSHTTSNDRLRILSSGFRFDVIDPWKGRDFVDVYGAWGISHFLGSCKAIDPHCSRRGAGGRFVKFNIDLHRIGTLYKDLLLFLRFSGQWSLYKLTLPEQMYIGGADTVRGFPLAVALGDSGFVTNGEIRFPIPGLAGKKVPLLKKNWNDFLQLVGFVDYGHVYYRGSGGNTGLFSAGPGVRIYGPYGLNFTLDFGFPLSHKDKTQTMVTYFKVTIEPF